MKAFLTLFFFLLFETAAAQETSLKAGANLNFTFQGSESYYNNEFHPVFPGLNLSYEKSFGERFSWLVNVDYTRPVVNYTYEISSSPYKETVKNVTSAFSLTPEIRVYFFKNQGLFYYKNQGFFVQLGLQVLSWKFVTMSGNVYGGPHSFQYLQYPFSEGKYYPYVPFGFGVKYPLSSGKGLEMNVQTNIYNPDHVWPLQVGMKFYWMKTKEKKSRPKAPEGADINESYFKAGAAMNTTLMIGKSHAPWDVYYPSYGSLNISYEKSLGPRTTFALNFEPVHKSIHFDTESGNHTDHRLVTVTQFSFIPELRVYLGNKYALKSFGRGFFLQAGFELFHYAFWKDESPVRTETGNGFSLYPAGLNGWFERNVPIGLGYKCPLKDGKGMELNLSTNLAEIINQGNQQTLTFGVKYFWKNKPRTN